MFSQISFFFFSNSLSLSLSPFLAPCFSSPFFLPCFFFQPSSPLFLFSFLPLLSYVPLSLSLFLQRFGLKKDVSWNKSARLLLYFMDVRYPYTRKGAYIYLNFFSHSTFHVLYSIFHVSRPMSHLSLLFPPGFRFLGPFDQRQPFFRFRIYIYISICITYQGNPYNQASTVYMLYVSMYCI